MKVFFHSPQFFPPLRFFHAILHSDLWVVADHRTYVPRSRHSRCRIKSKTGVQLLGVSVRHPCVKPICRVVIDLSQPWKRKFLEGIESAYMGTEYYEEYIDELTMLIEAPTILLSVLNFQTTLWAVNKLGKRPECVFANTLAYDVPPATFKQDICQRLNAELFHDEFFHPYYHQRTEPFEEGLSILDAILNIGAHETARLLK